MLRPIIAASLSALFATAAIAGEKMIVVDNVLIYNEDNTALGKDDSINWDDVDRLEALLREYPDVSMMQLNSRGGNVSAANYISDLVIDYGLNTHVEGQCLSSCTTIFLGGEVRTVARGSWVGFHQSSWESDAIERYYNGNRVDEGWRNEFEFAEWLYEDTQKEVFQRLEFLLERGVEGNFAIKTLRSETEDMWYPRRKELVDAGIIRP